MALAIGACIFYKGMASRVSFFLTCHGLPGIRGTVRQASRLKIIVLALVSLFVLGSWCGTGRAGLEGTTTGSALFSPGSLGATYICSKALFQSALPITALHQTGASNWGKPGVGSDFYLLFSPIDGLGFKADPLTGQKLSPSSNVSLKILYSVLIL